MKKLHLIIPLLLLFVSCQHNDYESYKMSWIGWLVLVAIGAAVFMVLVLKKGVADMSDEKNPVTMKDGSFAGFEPIGSYIGGHPTSENKISTTVFRRNSDCCMFFYKDKSYSMPEFKFKIKIKLFKNISVEDLPSIEKKITSGNINLTDTTENTLKKKRKAKTAFLTIDWGDENSTHSTIFSFEGDNAMQKANKAKDNLLRALN
jgi:hypothetical protein